MYSYPCATAASAISSTVASPSLHSVCICKSPLTRDASSPFLAIILCASVHVRKSRRKSGVFSALNSSRAPDGFSIHFTIAFSRYGPTLVKSVSDPRSLHSSTASTFHINALRDALRNARFNGGGAPSPSRANSSDTSAFVRGTVIPTPPRAPLPRLAFTAFVRVLTPIDLRCAIRESTQLLHEHFSLVPSHDESLQSQLPLQLPRPIHLPILPSVAVWFCRWFRCLCGCPIRLSCVRLISVVLLF